MYYMAKKIFLQRPLYGCEFHQPRGYEGGYFHLKCTRSHALLFINFQTKKACIDHKAIY